MPDTKVYVRLRLVTPGRGTASSPGCWVAGSTSWTVASAARKAGCWPGRSALPLLYLPTLLLESLETRPFPAAGCGSVLQKWHHAWCGKREIAGRLDRPVGRASSALGDAWCRRQAVSTHGALKPVPAGSRGNLAGLCCCSGLWLRV